MSYCTTGDLVASMDQDTLLALTDRDGDDKPDNSVIAAAISYAEAKIDAKLSGKYSVPLVATALNAPATIKHMTVDFARWRLLNGVPQANPYGDKVREAWQLDHKDWTDYLNDCASGDSRIPNITPNGHLPVISTGLAGDDVEKQFTLTRQNVGGTAIDTDEAGTMDVW